MPGGKWPELALYSPESVAAILTLKAPGVRLGPMRMRTPASATSAATSDGLQVRPFFVDGHVQLAEFQLADDSQRALERKARKTQR